MSGSGSAQSSGEEDLLSRKRGSDARITRMGTLLKREAVSQF